MELPELPESEGDPESVMKLMPTVMEPESLPELLEIKWNYNKLLQTDYLASSSPTSTETITGVIV